MAKKDKKKHKEKDKYKIDGLHHEARRAEEETYSGCDHTDEIKRLNRVIGQIEGIKKMLENARDLDAVLIQCKAVHSALKSVESRLLMNYLDTALDEIARAEKKKTREEKISELMDLYKPV